MERKSKFITTAENSANQMLKKIAIDAKYEKERFPQEASEIDALLGKLTNAIELVFKREKEKIKKEEDIEK